MATKKRTRKNADLLDLQDSVLAKLDPSQHDLVVEAVEIASKLDGTLSAERQDIVRWLKFLNTLPLQQQATPFVPFQSVKQALNRNHHGMEDVKDAILEYISVLRLQKSPSKTPILLLNGPPGVGKSSITRSIAAALQRPMEVIDLGGMDEAEMIRGYHLSKVSGGPGMIAAALGKTSCPYTIIVLDEIDKADGGVQHALLPVLDYSQNKSFKDVYTRIGLDLSGVLFIATSNSTETITPALLDRMELIELPSYTEAEKIRIGRDYILPEIRKGMGLTKAHLTVESSVMQMIIRDYTMEAGVRRLSQSLHKIGRKVARQVLENKRHKDAKPLTKEEVREMLGPDVWIERDTSYLPPGSVCGLSVWSTGSETDVVETVLSQSRHRPELRVTGLAGKSLLESAQIVLTLIKTMSSEIRLKDPDRLLDHDVHISFPSCTSTGADGPSAGAPMFMALYVLLQGVSVSNSIAMTGEVNLRGQVTEVGGIKGKILAAIRAGKKRAIIPKDNEIHLDSLPKDIRQQIEVVTVSNVLELLEACDFHEAGQPHCVWRPPHLEEAPREEQEPVPDYREDG